MQNKKKKQSSLLSFMLLFLVRCANLKGTEKIPRIEKKLKPQLQNQTNKRMSEYIDVWMIEGHKFANG